MRTYQKQMLRKTALKNVQRIAVMTIRELVLRKIAKSNFFILLLKRQLKKLSFLYLIIDNLTFTFPQIDEIS